MVSLIVYKHILWKKGRDGPTFYEGGWDMPVRTQEQILRDGGYPSYNKEADTFWGLKPPM